MRSRGPAAIAAPLTEHGAALSPAREPFAPARGPEGGHGGTGGDTRGPVAALTAQVAERHRELRRTRPRRSSLQQPPYGAAAGPNFIGKRSAEEGRIPPRVPWEGRGLGWRRGGGTQLCPHAGAGLSSGTGRSASLHTALAGSARLTETHGQPQEQPMPHAAAQTPAMSKYLQQILPRSLSVLTTPNNSRVPRPAPRPLPPLSSCPRLTLTDPVSGVS